MTIVKSEDYSGRPIARDLAKMELVSRTEHANARKAGAESSATRETSVEGALQSCQEHKSKKVQDVNL